MTETIDRGKLAEDGPQNSDGRPPEVEYHWTYDKFEPTDDLEQGDFLAPTEELRAILQVIHPYFCAPKYIGFLVASQSCDLVRRGKPPKRYINITAVRSLRQALPKLLSGIGEEATKGVFLKGSKNKVCEFLKRVIDQNEQSLGLFYMHSDELLGIGDPSAAYLRVAVTLRPEHYEVLMRARKGRLKPAFQAKLGWLLGNLYAQPATPDWADIEKSRESRVIDQLLRDIQWVGEAQFNALKAMGTPLADLTGAEIVRLARKQKVKRPIDELSELTAAVIGPLFEGWIESRLGTFKYRLNKLTPPGRSNSEQREADASSEPAESANEQIVALAREIFLPLTQKERSALLMVVKSDHRAKQFAARSADAGEQDS